MKELIAVVPYRALEAIYSPIPALVILNSGGSAIEVGLVATLNSIVGFFAPLFWSKLMKESNRKLMISLGYLGIFMGSFLLQYPHLVYLGSALLSFFPSAIHYAVLAMVKEKGENFAKYLTRLHIYNNISAMFGFLLGAFLSYFLSPFDVALIVSLLSLLLLPIASKAIGEEGFLPVIEEGLEEFELFAKRLIRPSSYATKPARLSSSAIDYLLVAPLIAAGNAFLWAQMITAIKRVFAKDYYVYALNIANKIAQVIFYNVAGMLKEKSYFPAIFGRILAAFLAILAITTKEIKLLIAFYFLTGTSWPFIQVFYDYVGLLIGEEVFGIAVSARTLAYALANAASGFLVEAFGLTAPLKLASLVFASTLPLYLRLLRKFEKKS